MKSHQVCRTCNYFEEKHRIPESGICRRYPPVICQQVVMAGSVLVTEPKQEQVWMSPGEWCGEWCEQAVEIPRAGVPIDGL